MFIFYLIFVKLAGTQNKHKISDEFECQIQSVTFKLHALDCWKKAIDDIAQSIVLLIFMGSLWNLQIRHKISHVHILARVDYLLWELPALIAEKIFDLLGMLDSGERSLPFGWLVMVCRHYGTLSGWQPSSLCISMKSLSLSVLISVKLM